MSQLIGRGVVMAGIRDRMMRLNRGPGSIVLIRGGAGIGKARVVSEAVTEAAADRFEVTRCEFQPTDHVTPFCAVRALLASLEGTISDRSLAEIAEAVDHMAVDPADEHGWAPRVTTLHETAERVGIEGGPQRPTLLALERLQHADQESLSLIVALLRGMLQHPVLVVASMSGADGRPPNDAGAEVERFAHACGVVHTLGEWTRSELRDFLSLHVIGGDDPRVVALVEAQAGGHPLLVQSALQAAASERSKVDGGQPPADRELSPIGATAEERCQWRHLQERLFDRDADRYRVAQVVSAFRRFSLSHLNVVVDHLELSEDRVAAGFDRLVGDGWLVAVGDGQFTFRHELVRTSCYDDLGPACRRRIHVAATNRLLATDDDMNSQWWLNEMATHIAALATRGNLSAVRILTMAARSSSADDPAAAARWYELALGLLPPGSRERAELCAIQARELWAASLPAEAADAGRQALDELLPGGDRDAVVALVADSLYAAGLLEEAIDLLESECGNDIRAASLAAQSAHFLGLAGRIGEADQIYATASSSLDDSASGHSTTLEHLAHFAHLRGRSGDVHELLDRLRRLSETRPARLGEVHQLIAMLQTGPGFVADAKRSLEAARTIRSHGSDSGRCRYLVALTQNQWLRGDWDGALGTAELAVGTCEANGLKADVAFVRSLAVSILVHRGQIGQARHQLESIGWAPEAHRPVALWASALVQHAHGDTERALEELATARVLSESGLGFWSHLVLSQQAELQIEQDDRRAARTVGDLVAWAQSGCDPWAQHLASRAQALLTGDPAFANEALSLALREGLEFDVARSRLLLGELGVDPEENLIEAIGCFDRLGADPWLRSATRLTRGLGLSVGRSPRRRAGLLSEAETRIASLVQEGLSNRQIATGLHYSVKTIEAYLTRIYTKTGCQSRLELARAMDMGRVPIRDFAEAGALT